MDVRHPEPVTVVVPSILPSERIVVVPFDRLAKPVILATLMTVPPDCVRLAAVPPVRFAFPAVTTKACREAFAVRLPLLTVVVPPTIPPLLIVVFPPVRLANPVILATLTTVPPDCVRLAAVPPVRLAVPDDTATAPNVALAVNVPAVTFDRPVTVAVFRLVVLLESIEANVPSEADRLPALIVVPTDPPVMLAVPAAPTVRLPRFWLESRVPPVTLARPSTWPPEMFEVPPVTVRLVRLPPD